MSNTQRHVRNLTPKHLGRKRCTHLGWPLSAGDKDEASSGFDSLFDKDAPDFDDIILDDSFYKVKTTHTAI